MLSIEDLSLRIAGRLLIEDASVLIPTGARVGLLGRNGTGKTTLFRAITGELECEQGSITMPRRARIGRLLQEAPDGPQTLLEVVLAADTERTELLAAAETETDPNMIGDIHTRLLDIDAHAAPSRAASILSGLGFSATDQEQPCASFSGGWRMRVALAALLFSAPDLLLLDEPTNYLDLEGTLWLQEYLARYPHTILIVSHDRDLLDSSVDHILHLDRQKLTLYAGTYTSFARQRAERQLLDAKHAKKQMAQRQKMEAFVARFRAKATKARQAQSRLKLLAKMEPIEAAVDDEVRGINIPSPEKLLSPPIIAFDRVDAGYGDKTVLRKLDLRVDNDDRIALIGSNGNGKSTFAKLLASRLDPLDGQITRADKLSIAYFAQHQLDELRAERTPYDHIRELMPDAPESKVRARVGTIGFSGRAADAKVSTLSGGEKARLMLGMATLHGPNLVILDEPTNHLDIDSRAALIQAINEYAGAVVLISHDRYLIEACADRLWLVADGTVAPFDGDIDDYRRKILDDRKRTQGAEKAGENGANYDRAAHADQRRAAAEKRTQLAPLRQQVKQAEKTIERWTKKVTKLDAQLTAPDLYKQPAKAAALAKARADAMTELGIAESQWLDASTQYESANAAV